MADVTSLVSGTRQAIGQYFSVVSVLPSILLVIYVFVLTTSGSWLGSPDWDKAFTAIRDLGFGGTALLATIGIAVALVLHPLQFAMTQILEGYWGPGRTMQQVRVARIRRYRERRQWLEDEAGKAIEALEEWQISDGVGLKVQLLSQRDEAFRVTLDYPEDPDHIMPTRLGNALRRYEVRAGDPYNLEAPTLLPYLTLVAPPEHRDYLNDQRSAMDLAVRTTLTLMLAFLITVVFLWHGGLWLLVALVPYILAYLSYRGSVVAAQSYGITMSTIITLNRFALYEYLHLPRPSTTARERNMNEMVMDLLQGDRDVSIRYRYPRPPTGS